VLVVCSDGLTVGTSLVTQHVGPLSHHSSGSHDRRARHYLQVGFTTFMVLWGLGCYIVIIGRVTALLSSLNTVKSQQAEKLDSVVRYCRARMVPKDVIRRVHAFFDFMWSVDGDVSHIHMIEQLPGSLQIEVAMSSYKRVIQKMPVLDGLTPKVCTSYPLGSVSICADIKTARRRARASAAAQCQISELATRLRPTVTADCDAMMCWSPSTNPSADHV
jgi:hypothetical protein